MWTHWILAPLLDTFEGDLIISSMDRRNDYSKENFVFIWAPDYCFKKTVNLSFYLKHRRYIWTLNFKVSSGD